MKKKEKWQMARGNPKELLDEDWDAVDMQEPASVWKLKTKIDKTRGEEQSGQNSVNSIRSES